MSEVMTPTEFVLWLNGATSMLEGPPSADQWIKMQENLHPIIAKMMAEKLMGMAEELQTAKSHKEQIERLQKEMSYRHQLEIETLKQRYARGDWAQYTPTFKLHPQGQNVHRNGQMLLDTGAVSISPNTVFRSSGDATAITWASSTSPG